MCKIFTHNFSNIIDVQTLLIEILKLIVDFLNEFKKNVLIFPNIDKLTAFYNIMNS